MNGQEARPALGRVLGKALNAAPDMTPRALSQVAALRQRLLMLGHGKHALLDSLERLIRHVQCQSGCHLDLVLLNLAILAVAPFRLGPVVLLLLLLGSRGIVVLLVGCPLSLLRRGRGVSGNSLFRIPAFGKLRFQNASEIVQ